MRQHSFRSEKSVHGLSLEVIGGMYAENLYTPALESVLTRNSTAENPRPAKYSISSDAVTNIGTRRLQVTVGTYDIFGDGDFFLLVGAQNGEFIAELRKIEKRISDGTKRYFGFDLPLSFRYDSFTESPSGIYKVDAPDSEQDPDTRTTTLVIGTADLYKDSIQPISAPFINTIPEINDGDATYSSSRLFDLTNKKTPTKVYLTRQSYNARFSNAHIVSPEILISGIGETVSRIDTDKSNSVKYSRVTGYNGC